MFILYIIYVCNYENAVTKIQLKNPRNPGFCTFWSSSCRHMTPSHRVILDEQIHTVKGVSDTTAAHSMADNKKHKRSCFCDSILPLVNSFEFGAWKLGTHESPLSSPWISASLKGLCLDIEPIFCLWSLLPTPTPPAIPYCARGQAGRHSNCYHCGSFKALFFSPLGITVERKKYR